MRKYRELGTCGIAEDLQMASAQPWFLRDTARPYLQLYSMSALVKLTRAINVLPVQCQPGAQLLHASIRFSRDMIGWVIPLPQQLPNPEDHQVLTS